MERRPTPVDSLLGRRGIRCLSHSPGDHLFLPPEASGPSVDVLYSLWSDYGFRIFLRDLLNSPEGASIPSLSRYASEESVEKFIRVLSGLNMIEETKTGLFRATVGDRSSFGVTLEWYVCRVLEKEFFASSVWSARLKDVSSGDFDVLAAFGSSLVYVDVTGSPPKHLDEAQTTSFLERIVALQPDLAVYVVDTHLRMRDKLVVLFERVLRRLRLRGLENTSIERFEDESFHLGRKLYVTNTQRSLAVCLQRCLQHSFPQTFEPTRQE